MVGDGKILARAGRNTFGLGCFDFFVKAREGNAGVLGARVVFARPPGRREAAA